MIAMTTSSSMSVKARRLIRGGFRKGGSMRRRAQAGDPIRIEVEASRIAFTRRT
jgi:hypothetical protein